MNSDDQYLAEIRKRVAAATPRPWLWWAREGSSNPTLICPNHGMLIVMDAVRSGMQGATLRFASRTPSDKGGILRKAETFLDGYSGTDFPDVRNPDMTFIAHARDDVAWLLARCDKLTQDMRIAGKDHADA